MGLYGRQIFTAKTLFWLDKYFAYTMLQASLTPASLSYQAQKLILLEELLD